MKSELFSFFSPPFATLNSWRLSAQTESSTTPCFASSETGWKRGLERPSTWLVLAQVRTPFIHTHLFPCLTVFHLFAVSRLSVLDGGDWGLDEKDMEASVATVCSMCEQLDADLILLRERNETAGFVRDYLIRRRVGELDFLEVR